MKVGDRVKHKTKKGVVGIVVEFGKHASVLVDLSNHEGVMYRKFKITSLEIFCEDR